jgi:hypothetical protein
VDSQDSYIEIFFLPVLVCLTMRVNLRRADSQQDDSGRLRWAVWYTLIDTSTEYSVVLSSRSSSSFLQLSPSQRSQRRWIRRQVTRSSLHARFHALANPSIVFWKSLLFVPRCPSRDKWNDVHLRVQVQPSDCRSVFPCGCGSGKDMYEAGCCEWKFHNTKTQCSERY